MDTETRNFALIGLAGYVAPRHLKAIKETGNRLVAALDRTDSVGILDSYFPDAAFFVEFERFDRHLDKLRRDAHSESVDYVSICSPNYLHDSHIRFALRSRAHALCEKPLVLNPWNLDPLARLEQETGKQISTILQLRLHPAIVELKRKVEADKDRTRKDIDLTYITSRGKWYGFSWKGDEAKSGGIATNIGVHFFDMLQWVFGAPLANVVHISTPTRAAGYLELERARVRWFLSLEADDLPDQAEGLSTFRSITIDGKEVEFSGGFAELHTRSYEALLNGEGFGLEDARPSVETVHAIRNANAVGLVGEYHPMARRV